jgi:hypothetical protein
MSMPKQPPRPQHFENVLQCYSFRTKFWKVNAARQKTLAKLTAKAQLLRTNIDRTFPTQFTRVNISESPQPIIVKVSIFCDPFYPLWALTTRALGATLSVGYRYSFRETSEFGLFGDSE